MRGFDKLRQQKQIDKSVIIPPHNVSTQKVLNIDDIICTSFNKRIKSSLLAAVQYPVQK